MKLVQFGDHVINPEAIDAVLFTPGGTNKDTNTIYPPSTEIVLRSGQRLPCPQRPAEFAAWLAEKTQPKEAATGSE